MIHSFASGWFLFINIKTNRMLALKDFSPNPVAWCGLTGGEEVDSGSAVASRVGPVLADPDWGGGELALKGRRSQRGMFCLPGLC